METTAIRQWAEDEKNKLIDLVELNYGFLFEGLSPQKTKQMVDSSYVYGVFGAQRSRDCTVTVLVSQIKRGHVTAL